MIQRFLCFFNRCRKSELGNWRLDNSGEYYVRPRRCPHCKMGYYEADNGKPVPRP